MKREIRLAAGCFSWPTITFSATPWFEPVGAQSAALIFIWPIRSTAWGKSSALMKRSKFPACLRGKKKPTHVTVLGIGKVHNGIIFCTGAHRGEMKRSRATYIFAIHSSKTNPGKWLPRRECNAALGPLPPTYIGVATRRRRHQRHTRGSLWGKKQLPLFSPPMNRSECLMGQNIFNCERFESRSSGSECGTLSLQYCKLSLLIGKSVRCLVMYHKLCYLTHRWYPGWTDHDYSSVKT